MPRRCSRSRGELVDVRRSREPPEPDALRGAPVRLPAAARRGARERGARAASSRFVWTAVTQDMLARHDVTLEEVEGLIDIMRRTAEADVACVLKEEANGTVKVSLRSVGAADVRRVGGRARRRRAPVRRRVHVGRRDRRDGRPHPRRTLSSARHHARRVGRGRQAGGLHVPRRRREAAQARTGRAGSGTRGRSTRTRPGVLLVGLGRVTRLLRFLQETTEDLPGRRSRSASRPTRSTPSGAVLDRRPMPLTEAEVVTASRRFVGDLQQVPPDGLRAEGRRPPAARARPPGRGGRAQAPRRCASTGSTSRASSRGRTRRRRCSWSARAGPTSGRSPPTSAPRSAVCAHLASLRRLRVGAFTIEESHPLAVIEADAPAAASSSPAEAMRDARAGHGRRRIGARACATAPCSPLGAFRRHRPGPFAVVDGSGALLAVYERRGAGLKPAVVLPPAEVAGS